ncbi:hypothetical protein E0Z10_g8681 [Xylaria hypoxylon]|uniref:Uncharacterized protein n=1 Tax=Xylaria hypoxylon TaxID=37992 RepID=A0A4Z0Y7H8_9PEZI|nr:hypothetical protein E0Z10_g8681 [Xylaria hypoxylon]
MNRFRTKRKGKDEEAVPRPSQESESSMPFRGFRKGKKLQENEKKEIDIAAALPSNDNFRTSLLMTGLSARFSMLREQDDPNTKIGKASDDSVLFPKRQSRMDLTSFRGLGDIAEVESIKTTPPFARMDSYHSDDADSLNAGSIMSRAKPTEGNNLFGGRQKIYKIPASASSSRTGDGGMSGRALYDDDVAQSAFQRWRRAEKERELSQDEPNESDAQDEQRNSSADLEPSRSESPIFSSYNRKRETSSTLSSTPSVARHSSAATSITSSQPTPSLKDGQPSNGYSSGPERNVIRTRRLYETGFFNQDAQESSTGGLSRIDTLSRQRPFGTRTPELGQQSPSLGFTDRLSGERRLLAKASAPNLRSTSPPASASPTGVPNLGIRVPSTGESKSNFGGSPPLSPPISETDENYIMRINPNDRGKATTLGIFQKPAQPYDESRFAQRQLQLQRGRETPTHRTRDGPNPPASRNESRSPSPTPKEMVDSPTAPLFTVTQSSSKAEAQPTSFLVDSDGSETSSMVSPRPLPSPKIHLRRPSDREHPAFRDSTLPTPLSLDMKTRDEPSPIAEMPSSLTIDSRGASPADSPTLGPITNGSGLSGMVRQHLRADSNASSIYGGVPPTSGLESRFPADTTNSNAMQEYGAISNPWQGEDHGRDWNLDLDVNEPFADADSIISGIGRPTESKTDLPLSKNEKKDEFANQLADGARRIRERLTSYVETDSRSSSPHRVGEQTDVTDLAPLPRPSGLGAILRPRSSRGSIVDRGRDPSSTKAFKMMGISPGGSRTGSPGSESQRGQTNADEEPRQEREDKETAHSGDDQPPGLLQFRQGRRELQRLKELESQSRHYPAPQGPPPDIPSPRQRITREPGGPRTRTPSRDHKPPPVYYQQRRPSEELWNGDSPANSQALSRGDRQRSESESSHETRPNDRAARSKDGLMSRESLYPNPAGSVPRPPIRSPGLPGTDIKRSHIMPPQPHPNVSLRMMNPSNFNSNGKLYVPRAYESGQPSPVSPGASPLVNSAPPTPDTMSPPRPSVAQNLSYDNSTRPVPGFQEGMRRKVRPRDISEPALVMSTSRVSTVALPPEAEDNRSRSNSRHAPPLPPINPRRRQDSTKVRTVLESFARQGRDNMERDSRANTPNPPLGQSRGNNPPINVGPPTSRVVVTQGRNIPNTGLPGGMI